ncbi:DUF1365 domain-containing protein [Klenkia taihuensis]|uniref:DUF1365 domain-containing protein n=1 Tax=Klenkia taihuensis TaxID=1225127 RepID=A0A1I1GFU3_9ACTN|nr:DUF1365 domain-containing protein [Klenkia taihuensis]GHE09858.1 DUF1365 domain-containing protein [Klenkia taihuensis]SFC08728.1 hypothetical protein SAMN05661030_0067 [Klenkia taihuensis]
MTAVRPGLVDWAPTTLPALYDVQVGHRRTHPLENAFEYGGYLWLVDLDDLPRLPRGLRWAARFTAADHLGDPAAPIKDNVVRFAALHGVDDVARVVMMANARSGPHVFNPLSTHWCYRSDGSLACIVAEVHNTYGERHAYLLHPDDAGRAEAEKDFYVSPFNTVDGRYLMRFSGPGDQLHVTMALQVGGRTPFVATLRGRARAAGTGTVVRTILRWPLMSLWVAALIRWQGIRLWARRLPVVPRPPHDPVPGVSTNAPRQHSQHANEDRS